MVQRLRFGYALAGAFLGASALTEIIGVPVALLVGRFLFLGVFAGLAIAWSDARTHSRPVARRTSTAWVLLAASLAVRLVAGATVADDWWRTLAMLPGTLLLGASLALFAWPWLSGPRRIVPLTGVVAFVAADALTLAFWDGVRVTGDAVGVILAVQGIHAMGNLLFAVAFLWASRRVRPAETAAPSTVSESAPETLSGARPKDER